MALDLNRLTLGEIAKFEDWSGLSIDQFEDDTSPKGRALAALVVIAKRREGHATNDDKLKRFALADALDLDAETAAAYLGMDDTAGEAAPDPKDSDDTTSESPKSSPTPPSTGKKRKA